MKVRELLNEYDAPKLTRHAVEALPEPDAKNVKDRYRVGSVAFDNAKGLGAVPNNQEVDYLGFAMELSPATFLKFAPSGDRSDDAAKIETQIKNGTPLGAPFYSIKLNYKEYGKGEPLVVEIDNHEGRARMTAIHAIEGDVKIPVHVFLKGGLRAHSLTEKFFTDIREIGVIPEDLKIQPLKMQIGKIFWMGKTL